MANKSLNGALQHLRKLAAVQSARQLADHELLERFAAGNDEAAFTVLVQRHAPMILGVCRRMLGNNHDAEDACQTVFLVLAQKATSIRKTTSLPSWLHGVAAHVAAHLRRERVRRCKREQESQAAAMIDPAEEVSWREVRVILDEELDRLPERLRGPLILCYLDGRTRDEAAQQLGLSVACLHGRLERGRKMLCERLIRRGVTLSAALLATALGEGVLRAALSPVTVLQTAKAAVLMHCGRALDTGLLSTKILALAQEVAMTMSLTKLKLGALALLCAGLLVTALGGSLASVGAGPETKAPPARQLPVVARQASEQPAAVPPAVSPPADNDRPAAANRGGAETVTVTGQVLAADGKPAAGAKVSVRFPSPLTWLDTTADGSAKKPLHVVADGDGRFAISLSRGERDMGVKVVAAAEGMGPDWVDVSVHNADKAVALRLRADDVVIEGRILDLERQPVAGAAIEVEYLERPVDGGDLKAWIAAQARLGERLFPKPPMKSLPVAGVAGIAASATSDKEGRFRLSGVGRETVAHLSVRGEGVENKSIAVCTRDDKAALISKVETYPARFELLLGPGKVATGTVTERGTGKPIAGAAVTVDAGYGHTDDKGRYRLTGVGKRDTHYAAARGPHHFIIVRNNVPDSPGAEPITIDFELQPAHEIRGRLIDKEGRPVRGFVWYSARPDNPNLKDLNAPPPALGVGAGRFTTADGVFRLLACPGPGYLVAKAELDRFTCAEFKEWKSGPSIPIIPGWKGDLVPAVPANLVPSHCHAIVAVEPTPSDPKSWTRDIVLDPGKTVKGTLVGPDGKPVAGALAFGLTAIMTTQPWMNDQPERITRLDGAEFTAFGVNVREPRPLAFVHPEKNLGKLILVRGDEMEPLEVQLEPLGTVTGRLIDSKGKPAAGSVLFPSINLGPGPGSIAIKDRKDLPGDLMYFAGSTHFLREQRPYPAPVPVDATGHFKVAGLLPGIKYALNSFPEVAGGGFYFDHLATVSVEAGKTTKDLGDLKLRDLP